MANNIVNNPTEQINADAEKWVGTLAIENLAQEHTKEFYDEETGENVRYVPSINFTDCGSADTQLPINVANETISILSKYRSEFDFTEFIREKLNYNSKIAVCMNFFSEQIDALVLAIKQFESGKALILGDMAGIGKGRVCAGILRYAYQQGLVPVFITEKENLFSDIYRDIQGIGGFGGKGGSEIMPKPFIMNPYTSDKKSVIIDDNDNELFVPLKPKEIDNILQTANGEFPFKGRNSEYDFNCVFLTYNVISKTRGTSGDAKRYFLRDIAPNSIFILDECHNASGRSKLGEWAKAYVSEAKGVLFSSATFAKNPQAFPLYIIKTAMAEAQIDVTNIEDAIGVGGENVSEYISSVLVKEGQMIRRERDFRGCSIGTIYDGSDKFGKQAEEAKANIYEKFDNATYRFRAIYNYLKKKDFQDAIDSAIIRKATELNINVVSYDDYIEAKGDDVQEADFIRANRDKYVIVRKETNTLGSTTKFHFTENILLAIKAKFTADAVIKELNSQVEYTNFDGKKKKTNRKPVIALRATGETLFDKLELKTGDSIANDFSEYMKAIISGIKSGKVVFRKVDADVFTSKFVMEENGKQHIEQVALFKVEDEDLPDGGQLLNTLMEEIGSYSTGIPLSPIDYLIDRIQSEQRASWDRFGSATINFKVGEITGRNYSLIKDKQNPDRWIFSPNERIKSVKSAFNNFNNGKTDVLIINSSGSTGGSIHSSETFADQRPRIMFITQIELNINTEVQKRGRINRSGQVNYPTYLYVLSQIPSEIRKFLALKRKLRKLDANTSANQTQNSDIISIKDKQGNHIEDVFNIYGEEAFNQFINDEDNFLFKGIYDTMNNNFATEVFTEEYAQNGEKKKALLQPFSRELEIYPCNLQEEFYDKMNVMYKGVVEEHKNNGTYQLEIDIEDLKASLRTRVVRQMNNGFSEFSKPLFMEDKYCLERRKLWTKEKVEKEIERMAKAFYKDKEGKEYQNITTFHNHLLEDFEVEYENFVNFKMQQYKESKEPKRADFLSDEEYNTELEKYEVGRAELLNRYSSDKGMMYELLNYFKPNRNIDIPETIVTSDEETTTIHKYGKFIGYSFKNTSIENKYSKGSIHLKFAFIGSLLSSEITNPTIELSMSKDLNLLLETKRQSIATFSATAKIGDKTMGERENQRLNEWNVNPNQRRTNRFLSGNILSGIQMANNMKDVKRWSLVKYTNHDGTISTGIRLDYREGKFFAMAGENTETINQPIQVSLDNPNVVDYIKLTPPEYLFMLGVNTYSSTNVEPAKNGQELIVRNLIRMRKSQNDSNKVFIEIFQGKPDKKRRGEYNEENVPVKNNSNANNPIFFAPFLKDYTVLQTKTYVKNSSTPYVVYHDSWENGLKHKSGFSKIYEFSAIDTEAGARRLKIFFKKLNEEQLLSLDFPQSINDYYNILFQADPYRPIQEQEKEGHKVSVFEDGDYQYKLEVDFDERYKVNLPPSFKRYEKGKTAFDKGIVILNQPILPTYARAYSVYPVNLSNEDTVKLFLSIFTEEERVEFIRQLTERVERGDSESQIGDFITVQSRKRTVPDLKYIFGNRRLNDIGELFKAYALKGDLSALSYEVKEETLEDVLRPKKKKDAITIEDAEKFINYLLF